MEENLFPENDVDHSPVTPERAVRGQKKCKLPSCRNATNGILSDYCSKHYADAPQSNRYQVQAFADRLKVISNPRNFMSMRDEIDCLRLSFDAIMCMCKTEHDLISSSARIQSMTESITKALTTAHKLERALGNVLDEQALSALFDRIALLISEVVTEPAALDALQLKIGKEVEFTIKSAVEKATEQLES